MSSSQHTQHDMYEGYYEDTYDAQMDYVIINNFGLVDMHEFGFLMKCVAMPKTQLMNINTNMPNLIMLINDLVQKLDLGVLTTPTPQGGAATHTLCLDRCISRCQSLQTSRFA